MFLEAQVEFAAPLSSAYFTVVAFLFFNSKQIPSQNEIQHQKLIQVARQIALLGWFP